MITKVTRHITLSRSVSSRSRGRNDTLYDGEVTTGYGVIIHHGGMKQGKHDGHGASHAGDSTAHVGQRCTGKCHGKGASYDLSGYCTAGRRCVDMSASGIRCDLMGIHSGMSNCDVTVRGYGMPIDCKQNSHQGERIDGKCNGPGPVSIVGKYTQSGERKCNCPPGECTEHCVDCTHGTDTLCPQYEKGCKCHVTDRKWACTINSGKSLRKCTVGVADHFALPRHTKLMEGVMTKNYHPCVDHVVVCV